MTTVLESAKPETPSTTVRPLKRTTMPSYKTMVATAATVVAVPLAFFLVSNRLGPAVGLLGGLLVGLAMSGMLYAFVNFGLSLFAPTAVTQDKNQHMGQVGGFAVLMIGKFLLVGVLLFVMIVLLKISLLWLVIGFLLTQTATIGVTMARLTKTKVTD